MNKTASLEWLRIAFHDLMSAQILYDADHYTDSIGSDLQQSIEKILKSLLAFENKKILKSHNLLEIYEYINDQVTVTEHEIVFLARATTYLKEDRYPNPNYCLPSKKEIKEVLDFTEELFEKVCNILEIDSNELK